MTAEPIRIEQHLSIAIPLSDVDPPTDEQRAEWKRQAEERKEAAAKQRVEYSKLRTAATGTLRKILTLHAPVGQGMTWFICGSCREGEAYDPVDWPCATAALALEE